MRRFSPKILFNNKKFTLILKNMVFKLSFPTEPVWPRTSSSFASCWASCLTVGGWALPYLWRLTSSMRHSSNRTNERTNDYFNSPPAVSGYLLRDLRLAWSCVKERVKETFVNKRVFLNKWYETNFLGFIMIMVYIRGIIYYRLSDISQIG